MKKIIFIFLIIIGMVLNSCMGSNNMVGHRLSKLSKETQSEDSFIQSFIENLKSGESNKILDMFSKNAIKKGNMAQKENIERIMSILGSDFTYEYYSGHTSSDTSPMYKIMRKTLQINEGEYKYKLIVKNVFDDENDPDEIGIRQIILCSEDNYGIFNISIYDDPQKNYGVYVDDILNVNDQRN